MKSKKLVYIIIIFLIFTIGIGYAFLEKAFLTNAVIGVYDNHWNVRFDNIKVKYGSVTANTAPQPCDTTSTLNFKVSLMTPGDFYEFTVDVVNTGTVDAKITNVIITPTLNSTQKNYLTYTVTYQSGQPLQYDQLVEKNSFVRLKIKIKYKEDYTGTQTTFENINASIKINYAINDGLGKTVLDKGVKEKIFADGDINQLGTIVTIGTEQFNVLGTEGNNVLLLAKYNLYVGGSYNRSTGVWTAYGDEATGMQNSKMIGYSPYISPTLDGITPFSTSEQKGTNYSDYQGSLVETYVEKYKTLVEKQAEIKIEAARLVTKNEVTNQETFACVERGSCSTTYPWIYNTSYWIETPSSATYIWRISSDKSFYPYPYSNSDGFGVRPVLIISKEYFK